MDTTATTKKPHPQLRQIESLFAAKAPLETAVITSTPNSITMATRRRSQTPEVTIIEKSVERDLGCDVHGGRRESVSPKRDSIGSLFGGGHVATARNVPDKAATTLPITSLSNLLQTKPAALTENAAVDSTTETSSSSVSNGNVPIDSPISLPTQPTTATPRRTFGLARKTQFPVSSVAPAPAPAVVLRSASAYSLNRAAQLRMRESADREAAALAAQQPRNVKSSNGGGVQRRQSFAAGGRNSATPTEAAR